MKIRPAVWPRNLQERAPGRGDHLSGRCGGVGGWWWAVAGQPDTRPHRLSISPEGVGGPSRGGRWGNGELPRLADRRPGRALSPPAARTPEWSGPGRRRAWQLRPAWVGRPQQERIPHSWIRP